MKKITEMNKGDLLNLNTDQMRRRLRASEIAHIAKTLDAAWEYDYQAAKDGRVGKHAELKCGRHSDIFFSSKIFLRYANIRSLMARQLTQKFYDKFSLVRPDWVIGIPDGATELGREIAVFLASRRGDAVKRNGKIILKSSILSQETVLLVEDVCTKGTALKEMASAIWNKHWTAQVLRPALVLINRGGLECVDLNSGRDAFSIISLVQYKANDWDPAECPLCKIGSEPIKPKATDENWQLLTTSQF